MFWVIGHCLSLKMAGVDSDIIPSAYQPYRRLR